MAVATWADFILEMIPFVSILPASTAFVLWSYAINVAETSKFGSSLAGVKLRNKAVTEGTKTVEEARKAREQKKAAGGELSESEKKIEARQDRMHKGTGITPTMALAKKSNVAALAQYGKNKMLGKQNKGKGARVDGVAKPPGRERGNVIPFPKGDDRAAEANILPTEGNLALKPDKETTESGRGAANDNDAPPGQDSGNVIPFPKKAAQERESPQYEPRKPAFYKPSEKSIAANENSKPSSETKDRPYAHAQEQRLTDDDKKSKKREPEENELKEYKIGEAREKDASALYAPGVEQSRTPDETLAPEERERAKEILAEEDIPAEEVREIDEMLRKTTLTIEEITKVKLIIDQHTLKIVQPKISAHRERRGETKINIEQNTNVTIGPAAASIDTNQKGTAKLKAEDSVEFKKAA
jgi:hypothetical protein